MTKTRHLEYPHLEATIDGFFATNRCLNCGKQKTTDGRDLNLDTDLMQEGIQSWIEAHKGCKPQELALQA